jgi:hypothetical protein
VSDRWRISLGQVKGVRNKADKRIVIRYFSLVFYKRLSFKLPQGLFKLMMKYYTSSLTKIRIILVSGTHLGPATVADLLFCSALSGERTGL